MQEDTKITGKWDLSDLFSSYKDRQFEDALSQITIAATKFAKRRVELCNNTNSATLRSFIKEYEQLCESVNRVMAYVTLLFSEDTQNSEYAALYGKCEMQITEAVNKTMFFSLWWKGLSDEDADRLIAESGDYTYFLRAMRSYKPYTLTESEEKIINLKDATGSSALNNIYEAITNRYQFNISIDGEDKTLTREGLMSYVHSSDGSIREKAYEKLYEVYANDGNILSMIYQNLVRDWAAENIQVRKFKTAISARNLSNDIPDEVVDLMLHTCEKNSGIFQDFFSYKKSLLKIEPMRRSDIYTSDTISNWTVSYSDALEMVLDSFSRFSKDFRNKAEKILSEHHVDSETRHGKRGGAFCLTAVPSLTPWVLLNYQEKIRDVSTIAHEFGHAIHSLCAEEKSVLTQEACLPLAETASTFSEFLFCDYLLSKETDPQKKRALLMQQMDDLYATIQRQAYFAIFEIEAHQMIADGASTDELNCAYLENLHRQFGNSVEVEDFFKWEWVSIPHFFASPFYVYAYCFGQLLVMSLYRAYQKDPVSFYPRYLELLSAGGSEEPIILLKRLGFDISSEAFWQGGFDVISERFALLKSLG